MHIKRSTKLILVWPYLMPFHCICTGSYDMLMWNKAPTSDFGATVGFNKNDGINSYSLPGSRLVSVGKDLTCGGRKGCYTFRVDQNDISGDTSASASVSPRPSTTPSLPSATISGTPIPSWTASASSTAATPTATAAAMAPCAAFGTTPPPDPCSAFACTWSNDVAIQVGFTYSHKGG